MCLMPRTKTIPCGYSVIQASLGDGPQRDNSCRCRRVEQH